MFNVKGKMNVQIELCVSDLVNGLSNRIYSFYKVNKNNDELIKYINSVNYIQENIMNVIDNDYQIILDGVYYNYHNLTQVDDEQAISALMNIVSQGYYFPENSCFKTTFPKKNCENVETSNRNGKRGIFANIYKYDDKKIRYEEKCIANGDEIANVYDNLDYLRNDYLNWYKNVEQTKSIKPTKSLKKDII